MAGARGAIPRAALKGGAVPPAALKGGAVGAVVGGGLMAAEGTVLGTLGFTAAGPAAGSWAAGWMSSIALSNGVGVTAGSWFAAAQSAAMGGTAIVGAPVVVTCVAVGAVGWWYFQRNDALGGGVATAPATGLDEEAKREESSKENGTGLDEEAKREESSEENGTEGDLQSDELIME